MKNETAYAPGGKEREELELEFERIRKAALPPRTMLPAELSGEVVEKCYSALCDVADKFGDGIYTKEISVDMARRAKNNYIKARRAEKWHGELIRKDHERYMRQGQTFKRLIDCDEKAVSIEEWFENLFEYINCHYNEVEEKILKEKFQTIIKRMNEGAPKAKKGKKKKTSEKKAALNIPDELKEAWNDFSEMRKEKRKPMTERAAELLYNRLMKFAEGDLETAKKMLEKSTRNAWTDVFRLDEDETKPKATGKQGVFGSEASYDISEFEKNIVGLKYLDEESGEK